MQGTAGGAPETHTVCISPREGKAFLNAQNCDEDRRRGAFSPGPVAIQPISFLVLRAVSQSQAPCASVWLPPVLLTKNQTETKAPYVTHELGSGCHR